MTQIARNKTGRPTFCDCMLKISSSFFPLFVPISLPCLSVKRHGGERHSDMLVDSRKQRLCAITAVLTPQGPELSKVSDLHLCEITEQNKKKNWRRERSKNRI